MGGRRGQDFPWRPSQAEEMSTTSGDALSFPMPSPTRGVYTCFLNPTLSHPVPPHIALPCPFISVHNAPHHAPSSHFNS
ncbi:hypothetical protein E2C01_034233 [Portunus trituberculatus]|uniref:Uncharacterized protein n=1 Tax=Portunus trituberculatus TaxID=210409 RepID=A0A5B7F6F9_PORTR|nr:hypothetical protein [Portunus trituberculatus]